MFPVPPRIQYRRHGSHLPRLFDRDLVALFVLLRPVGSLGMSPQVLAFGCHRARHMAVKHFRCCVFRLCPLPRSCFWGRSAFIPYSGYSNIVGSATSVGPLQGIVIPLFYTIISFTTDSPTVPMGTRRTATLSARFSTLGGTPDVAISVRPLPMVLTVVKLPL